MLFRGISLPYRRFHCSKTACGNAEFEFCASILAFQFILLFSNHVAALNSSLLYFHFNSYHSFEALSALIFISISSVQFLHFHIWRFISIFGASFPYLALHFHIWRFISIFGASFPYLALHFHIRRFVSIFGASFPYLALHFHIWRFTSIFGASLPYLPLHFHILTSFVPGFSSQIGQNHRFLVLKAMALKKATPLTCIFAIFIHQNVRFLGLTRIRVQTTCVFQLKP